MIREKLDLDENDQAVFRIKRDRLVPEGFRAFTISHFRLKLEGS